MQEQTYRGRDRRGVLHGLAARPAPLLMLAAAALFAIALVDVPASDPALPGIARGSTSMLLAGLGLAAWLRFRWFGDARSAHLASALWALAVGLAVIALAPAIIDAWPATASQFAGGTVAAVVAVSVLRALRSPDVNTRLRPRGLLVFNLAVVAAACLVLATVLGLTGVTGSGRAFAAVVALSGAVAVHGAAPRASAPMSWAGVALLATALPTAAGGVVPGLAGLLLPIVVLLVCLGRATTVLRETMAAWQRRPAPSRVPCVDAARTTVYRPGAQPAAAAQRGAPLSLRARDHELRNAVLAVEGATASLLQLHAQPDAEVVALQDALGAELVRLRNLLEGRGSHPARVVDVVEVVRRQVLLARALGWQVEDDLPERSVEVDGDSEEIAEIVQNLLVNAAVHGAGPAAPQVTIQRSGAHTVDVQVADRGGGICPQIRDRVLHEPVESRVGSGVGLHTSAVLAARRGAELVLEDRTGGGTIARLRLPAAQPQRPDRATAKPTHTRMLQAAR